LQAKNWATPTARIWKGSGTKVVRDDGKSRMDMLDYQAEQGFSTWPTPMVPNGGRSIAHAEIVGATVYHNGKKVQRDLGAAAKMWPTPHANCTNGAGRQGRQGGENIQTAASVWPTPRASDNENRTTQNAPSHGVSHGATLAGTAGSWQTITATDAKSRGYSYSNGDHSKPFLSLTGEAQTWPTPVAQDDNKTPAAHMAMKARMKGGPRKKITSLSVISQALESLPQDLTILSGQISSETSQNTPPPSRRKLNPAFVTWLMGLPRNWLSGGSISFEFWETASSQLLLQELSYIWEGS
jgi:hypothetical protein